MAVRVVTETSFKAHQGTDLTTFDGDPEQNPAAAKGLIGVGESPLDEKVPTADLAAWTLVASQVMNLDESLTK